MIAIVGCGFSGLCFAQKLEEHGIPFFIIDKSKGVGGRLATRRWDEARFDHGTQQLLPTLNHDVSQGMTHFAKTLSQNKTVHLDQKVVLLTKDSSKWTLSSESGSSWTATHVVLSCPLPQSLDLLEKSSIAVPAHLRAVRYNKTLIALVRFSQKHRPMDPVIYQPHPQVEAIYDQLQKGVSKIPAWTLVFNSQFSEENFEKSGEELLALAQKTMSQINIPLPSFDLQIKKWRYARVQNPLSDLFWQSENLFVMGDAFAGGDLQGAQKSAHALAAHFLKNSVSP